MNIDKLLKKEKNLNYISEFNFRNKSYVRAYKIGENEIKFYYFEIENGKIKEIQDEELLQYFKKQYELESTDIIE